MVCRCDGVQLGPGGWLAERIERGASGYDTAEVAAMSIARMVKPDFMITLLAVRN